MDTEDMGNKLPTLLEPEFLHNLLKEADFDKKYRLIEANFGPSSREDFEKSHIKNAIYFDTMTGFEPSKLYPRDWPKPDAFEEYLSQLGISNKHKIIIYDRSPQGFFASSRVWVHLRAYGNDNVSILNGGFNLWLKNNYEVTNEVKSYTKTEFKVKEDKSLSRNYEDILKSLDTKTVQLVDARPRDDFNKENALLGQNHISSAKNFPYTELFDTEAGKLKERTKLIEMLKQADIDLSLPTILYCNSSVTVSSVAFVGFILGYEKLPIYKG